MPFKKGMIKTAAMGRKKGTPNKRRTIFESLEEIQTKDGRPVDIVKLFFEGLMTMPPFQRVDALLDFMKFVYPQQRSVELSNKEGEGFKLIIEDYRKKDE
jgi:hypothetical protein